MRLQVKNVRGQVVRSLEARDDVFGRAANPALVHQVMVGQQANLRQGTAATKTRGYVSGGGRKPRPQKGTGFSRAGSIRIPHWRGGGVVFGSHPRSYRVRTPKRMRRQAMLSVLSDKAREDQLVVLEALDLDEAKTREMVRMLSDVGAGPSVLLLGDGAGPGVLRCARNIQRTKTIPAYQLNAIDLLRHQSVVMTLEAVSTIEALWGGTVKGGRKAYEPAVESEEAAA